LEADGSFRSFFVVVVRSHILPDLFIFQHGAYIHLLRRGVDVRLPASFVNAIPSYNIPQVAKHIKKALFEWKKSQPSVAKTVDQAEEDELKPKSLWYWFRRIHWVNFTILTATPALAIWGLFNIPMQKNTMILAVFYYFFTGLGITGLLLFACSPRSYFPITFVVVCSRLPPSLGSQSL
jgi:hypothetical protein